MGAPYQFEQQLSVEVESFAYAGKSSPALKGIDFALEKGKILGITGRTGSGKSTLIQLIAGQLGTDSGAQFSGSIQLDGTPSSHVQKVDFRRHLAYVPQDVFLFSETIEENIRFGAVESDCDESCLENAIDIANLKRDLEHWPKGLQTILGERGVSLSGGQKQRVSLARALVRQADLFLLDDCLSAVDAETEQKIIEKLKAHLKGKTAIIVSHRIAPLQFTDEVLVLDEGSIIQKGTHDSLLTEAGLYRQLYDRQFEEE
jgi:ATP-binding cassette subfamily B multidrug efflux pump